MNLSAMWVSQHTTVWLMERNGRVEPVFIESREYILRVSQCGILCQGMNLSQMKIYLCRRLGFQAEIEDLRLKSCILSIIQ